MGLSYQDEKVLAGMKLIDQAVGFKKHPTEEQLNAPKL
jgi:hypothetical protein